jgi:hypothetical protein
VTALPNDQSKRSAKEEWAQAEPACVVQISRFWDLGQRAPVFRHNEKGEHDLLIVDYAVQMASSDDVLEKDH